MTDKNLKKLQEEFIQEGASQKEALDLSLFSKNLSNLYDFKRSDKVKSKFLFGSYSIQASKKAYIGIFLSILLLLAFTVSASAQNSLPGDPLYPVKRLSENFISFVDPSFKGEILKRRSEEIKSLSQTKNYSNIPQAIKDYEKNLNQNKNISEENIEVSKKNLEEARSKSTEFENEIEGAIQKTEQKQHEEVKGIKTIRQKEDLEDILR